MNLIVILIFLKLLPMMAMDNQFNSNPGKQIEIEDCPAEGEKLKVVAFGNSITATRNTIKQVYAQRLPSLLLKKGIRAEVINAGAPGSHTGSVKDHDLFKIRHGMDRFETDVLAHNPDLVIIGFGTNDAYIDGSDPEGPSRIPLANYEKNLSSWIESLQEKSVQLILIAPNCLGKKFPRHQNERLYVYVQTVRKLSEKYSTGLVDNYQMFLDFEKENNHSMEELMLDGIHPNDLGHERIAHQLVREITRLVENPQNK